jgi:UDP-glucose 4-epimerase
MAVNVFVTGANGFLGRALCDQLHQKSYAVRAAVRSSTELNGKQSITIPSIDSHTAWGNALQGVDVVMHLAARVHIMHDKNAAPIAEYRKTNVAGTLHLAKQAAAAGVKRFIFISSIKVNGEQTSPGQPFRATDIPAPQDPYGISKMEAEAGLRAIAQDTGMEVVIIRPPLVYGPGVKANFASMVRWLQRGVPLPFGAIHNQRSLVALDNLVDLIITCSQHPAAANQTFMVSDGEDVSTSDLLRRMGAALGKPARLLPVPHPVLEWGARLAGKPELAQRLFSSLQLDMQATRQTLGWSPPVSLEQGLRLVAQSVL